MARAQVDSTALSNERLLRVFQSPEDGPASGEKEASDLVNKKPLLIVSSARKSHSNSPATHGPLGR